MNQHCVWLLLFAFSGCSARRLPPGTPPPEYEPPIVLPWVADAGSDSSDAAADAPKASSFESGPELSPDAGVR
jgi:hypothetical protein